MVKHQLFARLGHVRAVVGVDEDEVIERDVASRERGVGVNGLAVEGSCGFGEPVLLVSLVDLRGTLVDDMPDESELVERGPVVLDQILHFHDHVFLSSASRSLRRESH